MNTDFTGLFTRAHRTSQLWIWIAGVVAVFLLGSCGAPVATRVADGEIDTGAPNDQVVAEEIVENTASPVLAAPTRSEPTITDMEGSVELMTPQSGGWSLMEGETRLEAGYHVRTGEQSRARLYFPDSSQAFLAPNTEIHLASMQTGLDGEGNVILLEQLSGETLNVVADGAESVYEVDTPSATGVSEGGVFYVHVLDNRTTRMGVSKGQLLAAGEDDTQVLTAGRTMSIIAGAPSQSPGHAVTASGIVEQTGDTWTVGGHTFAVDANTVIASDVVSGVHAHVEGHATSSGLPTADLIYAASASVAAPPPISVGSLVSAGLDASETCVTRAGIVVRIEGQTLFLQDGTTVDLNQVEDVEGQIETYSAILAVTCRKDDGALRTFVYVLEEAPTLSDMVGKVTICHVPPDNPANLHTVVVGAPAVPDHLSHGDFIGPCPDLRPVERDDHEEDDDRDGDDDEADEDEADEDEADEDEDEDADFPARQVTLCHRPPGNSDNAHMITVGAAAVEAHLAHGDSMGACVAAEGHEVKEKPHKDKAKDKDKGKGKGKNQD